MGFEGQSGRASPFLGIFPTGEYDIMLVVGTHFVGAAHWSAYVPSDLREVRSIYSELVLGFGYGNTIFLAHTVLKATLDRDLNGPDWKGRTTPVNLPYDFRAPFTTNGDCYKPPKSAFVSIAITDSPMKQVVLTLWHLLVTLVKGWLCITPVS